MVISMACTIEIPRAPGAPQATRMRKPVTACRADVPAAGDSVSKAPITSQATAPVAPCRRKQEMEGGCRGVS